MQVSLLFSSCFISASISSTFTSFSLSPSFSVSFSFFFSLPIWYFSTMSRHPAESVRLPCAAVRPAVPVALTGVRPGPQPPVSAEHRTAVSPRACWPVSADLRPRAYASVSAYCPSRRRSCRSPGSCAVARPSANVCARPSVLCTWNLWGTGRSGTASRRCCPYCASAYGRGGCPSAGNSCHILCTRMDVHQYGNACDLRDAPATEKRTRNMKKRRSANRRLNARMGVSLAIFNAKFSTWSYVKFTLYKGTRAVILCIIFYFYLLFIISIFSFSKASRQIYRYNDISFFLEEGGQVLR